MRLDSAEVSSDLSLARSVTMKRLETSAACPIRSSVAGSMSWIQMPADLISAKCSTSSPANTPPEIASAGPALSRGSSTMR